MKKKILCSFLALLVINLSVPHAAWAANSGNCGPDGNENSVTWELDVDSGTLTISGTGQMKDYNYSPWYNDDRVKSVVIEKGVTSIGNCAFASCTRLTSVTIPESVTSIGFDAFKSTNLKSVTIPGNVTSFGSNVFQFCSNLESVTILYGVTSIGYGEFDSCSSLTSVTIPESVTSIGRNAFYGCSSLTSITIPENVTSIESSTFSNCTSLTSVNIPEGVTSIGDWAFGGTNLKSVTIPENVTSIGKGAFFGCPSLVSVAIPKNVNSIGGQMFESCTNLTSVTIPENVTSIGENAFKDCSNLNTFFYKEGLNIEDAKVPEKTTKIAYTVNAEQNTDDKTEVTLVSSTKEVTIPCNAMGEGYKITANNTANKDNKVTITHDFSERVVEPTSDNLGGKEHNCTECEYKYWTDFTRDKAYNQTAMPDGETIYHYCTHNGLAAETTVDVGDGKTLRVFLQDPLRVLKTNDSQVLGLDVEYVPEGSTRYNELMRQVDRKHPIEHIKFFNVHPTVDGHFVTDELSNSVYMEYEIPEGWDKSDLEMILVKDSDDQEFIEKVLDIDGKRYLAMWKNHFSPYAMIDKLTNEEKAALQVKTSDNSGCVALMSSAMLITAGLFLEICMRRKKLHCN